MTGISLRSLVGRMLRTQGDVAKGVVGKSVSHAERSGQTGIVWRLAGRCLTLIASLSLVCVLLPAWASEGEADAAFRYDQFRIRYDVNADGTFVMTRSYAMTLLKPDAIEEGKQVSFSYSTSIEEGEVLEAWTRKASGQRIMVPKDNYQVQTESGRRGGSPFFSDRTTVTLVMPDVEVGDQVHFAYRIKAREAIFPGQFSLREEYSKYYPFPDADITITTPVSMKTRHQAWNLKEEPAVVEKGRRISRWTFTNPVAVAWQDGDTNLDILSENPVLLFSTLKSYRQISDAYGQRATPKAAVTDKIRQLATSITRPDAPLPEKARALYDWVARNITYGGNCIGVGAVVPRDLDVVLDNRIGDCKDHATLLQALYSAVGIRSTQALVNAGALYDLPDVPVVSNINHVINYVPELDLFLDSTASDIPFGHLPFMDADKPVLLVDNHVAGKRTRPETGDGSEQVMKTRIMVGKDGAAKGTVEIKTRGSYAITARGWFRDMPKDYQKDAVRYALQRNSMVGKGELVLEPDAGEESRYAYRATFELEDFLQDTQAGAFPVRPILQGPANVSSVTGSPFTAPPVKSRSCAGGSSTEEYVIEFPEGFTLLHIPRNQAYSRAGVDYSSTYDARGNTVTVVRKVTNRVERNVCDSALMAERHQLARQVAKDVRSQVLYRLTD